MRRKRMTKEGRRARRVRSHLKQVNLYAAGIDIGSRSHFVAVPEELDEGPVREFAGFTGDLHQMADWLVEIGIQTVAMESTGVYWIPVYEVLEMRGLEVLLVDARHVKNVPGRKTDVVDCQWLQQLHTYGLLRGAFRPADDMAGLRSYLRQREGLIASASDSIRHMQKALRQMNLLLDNVVSDAVAMNGRLRDHWKVTIERSIFLLCRRRWSAMIFTSDRLRRVRGLLNVICGESKAITTMIRACPLP